MFSPSTHPWINGQTLGQHLESRGIGRREFMAYCRNLCIVLGLGPAMAPRVVHAIQKLKRPTVIWLELQECTGCVESVLRSGSPTVGELLLDLISLDYSETLMAGAGEAAERAKHETMERHRGEYLLVVTGSVPLGGDGMFLTIAGRTGKEVLEEAVAGAKAVLALGACAHWGSVQAARPNPTGAVGIPSLVKDKPLAVIAGCPPIADVVTATVVHYLTFGRLPAVDAQLRPLFAYGARIHDQCSRRANFDAGQFVEEFDDEAARKGWCLYKVGCKGPATFSPCPIFMWNGATSWPIGSGHPCLGCTEPNFWDTMTPFYGRLPDVAGFGVESRVDLIGAALAMGALGGVAAHAAATGIHLARQRRRELPVVEGGAEPKGGDRGQN